MTPEKLREAAQVLKEMHRVAGPRNYTNTFDSEEIVTVFEAADACTTLAAANERVKELEVSAQRDGMHFMPSTLKMGIHPDTIEELHLHDELCCDLVAMRMDRLIQDLKAAIATAERERELLRKEVRRMDQLIANPHSNPTLYGYDAREAHQIIKHERPAEVDQLIIAPTSCESYEDAVEHRIHICAKHLRSEA